MDEQILKEDDKTREFLKEYEELCKKWDRKWSADIFLSIVNYDIQRPNTKNTGVDSK